MVICLFVYVFAYFERLDFFLANLFSLSYEGFPRNIYWFLSNDPFCCFIFALYSVWLCNVGFLYCLNGLKTAYKITNFETIIFLTYTTKKSLFCENNLSKVLKLWTNFLWETHSLHLMWTFFFLTLVYVFIFFGLFWSRPKIWCKNLT